MASYKVHLKDGEIINFPETSNYDDVKNNIFPKKYTYLRYETGFAVIENADGSEISIPTDSIKKIIKDWYTKIKSNLL